MRVKLLVTAKEDLKIEARFYEKRQPGLGGYFLSALYADIESLSFFAGIHIKLNSLAFTDCWPANFLVPSIMKL